MSAVVNPWRGGAAFTHHRLRVVRVVLYRIPGPLHTVGPALVESSGSTIHTVRVCLAGSLGARWCGGRSLEASHLYLSMRAGILWAAAPGEGTSPSPPPSTWCSSRPRGPRALRSRRSCPGHRPARPGSPRQHCSHRPQGHMAWTQACK